MKGKNKNIYSKIIFTAFLALNTHFSFGQEKISLNGFDLYLKPAAQLEAVTAKCSSTNPSFFLAKLAPNFNKKELLASGISVGNYIGDQVFELMFARPFGKMAAKNAILSWAEQTPETKISHYFDAINDDEEVMTMISLFDGIDTGKIKHFIALAKAEYSPEQAWTSQNKWIINLKKSAISELAKCPAIAYISPKFKEVSLENNQSVTTTNIDAVQSNFGPWGLKGEGVTFGNGDDSPPTHLDYSDRIINFNPAAINFHGTFTAGITTSAGNIDETHTGFAPKANIVSNYFSNIIAYGAQYEQNFNVKVTNNSYAAIVGSCSYAGTYDITSQYTDQLAISNPELLNVFSAGNDGFNQCGTYPTKYATVVGSFQAAKNSLVVAEVGKNADVISLGGSAGPTKDGRLKPEITAVGESVTSTSPNNTYGTASGTSASCPNVTGAAVLIQQRYKQQHGGAYPKAALVKALLMNGATDVGRPGPDFIMGFGKLNVAASLEMLDNNRFVAGTINNAATQLQPITVPTNVGQLKVMLYWNDVPSSPAASYTLVNDLDLSLVTPANTTQFPLILDPSPTGVTANAIPGIDHTNNAEQVVIDNPVAGTYNVKVTGFDIPTGSQDYFIVYTFVNKDINIIYPVAGSKITPNISSDIHWEVYNTTTDFTIAYSIDNGFSWNTIATVPADKRHYNFTPPANLCSDQCLIRISRTGSSSTSGSFKIIDRPLVNLSSSQCPGNIQIEWPAVTGATKYYLYRKIGAEMAMVDSTTSLYYTFTGLNADSSYWVSVTAGYGSGQGLRSIAVSRTPNSGDCATIANDGDLSVYKIVSPQSGRLLTSTALSSNTNMALQIRNNDNVNNTNYQILYRINNGVWTTVNPPSPLIPAAGIANINITGLNLATAGTYTIDVVVKNLALSDPISQNDTLSTTVYQLNNAPIDLTVPYISTFESVPLLNASKNIIGISGEDRFDFANTQNDGRIRSYVQDPITVSGNRSMSMDVSINHGVDLPGTSSNTLTATYNLSNYNAANDQVRFEFEYRLHGISRWDSLNRVYVRGSDTDPWIKVAGFDTLNIGTIKKFGAIPLSNILAANGQSFSSSTQVRINQRANTLIGGLAFGQGLTLDNLKLFRAVNDLTLVKANNINLFNCGLNSTVPLTVQIGNTMPQNATNIPIHFQIDNQTIVNETISSLLANDTINYTFATAMDLSAFGPHTIRVWINYTGDNYAYNDTLRNLKINNQPFVNTFPYLEGFETNNGFYFSDGLNSSWEYGDPSASSIDHAANGSKVWKTNLSGSYNANETSYLYSPCFDLSGLSNPMLSFSLLYEIETPPGATNPFDIAYMDFSLDGGQTWTILGANNQGYNWYNYTSVSTTGDYWAGTDSNFWRVASIPLPAQPSVSLRWVIKSDPGAEFNGLSIDDVHIFDYIQPIFDQDSFPTAPNATLNTITNFNLSNNVSGIIDPGTSNFGTSNFQSYKHTNFISPDSQQYFLPRNFTLKSPNYAGTDSLTLNLFLKDSMMTVIRNSTLCNSCTAHPREIYQMGVTTYTDPSNPNAINNTISDNIFGTTKYLNRDSIQWIPYFDGYYAQFKTDQIGEYWFNDGGITQTTPLPVSTITFTAEKTGNKAALLSWSNMQDQNALTYQLQADNGSGFNSIYQINSVHVASYQYTYIDIPSLSLQPFVLYRLQYTNIDGKKFYSPIRKLQWDGLPSKFDIYPNPTHDGDIYLSWYNNNETNVEWTLYSILGQKISSGNFDLSRFSGVEKISLKKYVQIGTTYILKLKFQNQTKEYKILYQAN